MKISGEIKSAPTNLVPCRVLLGAADLLAMEAALQACRPSKGLVRALDAVDHALKCAGVRAWSECLPAAEEVRVYGRRV